jgi:sulfide:quinone oxidoreductase
MSIQLTRHTTDFATSPQVKIEEMKEVVSLGFKTLINNRPDGEAADQPTHEQIKEAAGVFGLHYIFLPVVSSQVGSAAAEFGKLLAAAPKPALAFCRSGTRSTMLYQTAMAQKPSK